MYRVTEMQDTALQMDRFAISGVTRDIKRFVKYSSLLSNREHTLQQSAYFSF